MAELKKLRHPAKYTDSFMSIFAECLSGCTNVLDPFGGVGKIGANSELRCGVENIFVFKKVERK